MRPIAVFYHCLFFLDQPENLLPNALGIVAEQMNLMHESGLTQAASHILCGINGGEESRDAADLLLPSKATKVFHGLNSHAENLTIVEIEKWVPSHPGWNVLYFHSKGATHPLDSSYGNNVSAPWRRTMNGMLVRQWKQCVLDLESGYESVGCHFMRHMADGTQNIWAGNFWWATSDFLSVVPSIFKRERIHTSGIADAQSRFEAEVWIGNGRLPKVKEYLPSGGGGVP